MSIYKRTLWGMIKGIIGAPFAGIIVIIVLSFFIDDQTILIGIGAAVALLILYISVFGESIHFELDNDGNWRYYKRGKVKKKFNLNTCMIGYHRKSEGGLFGDHDISLHIMDDNGNETHIDCSPIGPRRFEDMYDKMKKYTREEPEVLSTGSGK